MIKLSINDIESASLPRRHLAIRVAVALLIGATITAGYFAFLWRPADAGSPVSTSRPAAVTRATP